MVLFALLFVACVSARTQVIIPQVSSLQGSWMSKWGTSCALVNIQQSGLIVVGTFDPMVVNLPGQTAFNSSLSADGTTGFGVWASYTGSPGKFTCFAPTVFKQPAGNTNFSLV